MKRSRLGDLAQLAEIIAAIAVVLSLIYVGRGLNDNVSAIRASSVQAITTGTREALLAVAVDEDLSRITQIGRANPSLLTDEELYRYLLFTRQRWLFFQGIWIQKDLGVLDERVWDAYATAACEIANTPGNRTMWPNHVAVLDTEFVRLIEGCFE